MSKILTDDIIPALKSKIGIDDSGWLDLNIVSPFNGTFVTPQYRRVILPGGGDCLLARNYRDHRKRCSRAYSRIAIWLSTVVRQPFYDGNVWISRNTIRYKIGCGLNWENKYGHIKHPQQGWGLVLSRLFFLRKLNLLGSIYG